MIKRVEIIPAILEKNFSGIKKKIEKLNKNFRQNNFIQIDVCDGKLTPQKTYGSGGCLESFLSFKKITKNFYLELDIIMDMREEYIPKNRAKKILNSIKNSDAKRVIFHNKGVLNWDEIFDYFKKNKTEIGLGIWLSDENKNIENILREYNFDYIQIMGIEKVGYGGQTLSNKVFKKAKYFLEKFPKMIIQVDGGVKVKNSAKLKQAGVSRFISGSGIFKFNKIKDRIKEFKNETI